MTSSTDLLVLAAICGLLLLIAGIVRYRPPRQINWLYGYRTTRSMRNAATWQEANTYFARYFWRLSWALPVVTVAAVWLFGTAGALLVLSVVLVAGLLFGAIRTEQRLRRQFDDNGQLRT